MQRIPREKALGYLLSKDVAPMLRVKPGERFVIETEDNVSGCIKSKHDLVTPDTVPGLGFLPAKANPVGGPVYIEGVRKGDVVVVHIEQIVPHHEGLTFFGIGIGPLDFHALWPQLHKPYTHIIPHWPGPSGTTRDGVAQFTEKVTWRLQPFIGTIALAPEWEAESSVLGQGPWGGNLDVRDIKEGSRLFLNSYNEGGLLFVGDVHASQADTEWYGAANECKAEVTLSCEVTRGKRLPGPRIEKADSIVAVHSAKPLEEAVNAAIMHLMEWMVGEHGVDPKEAYMHMSCNPDVRINVYQMCAINRLRYTVGAEIPKRYLT